MAPQGWMTPAQLESLWSHMDVCHDAKAKGNVSHFHHKLYRDWFQSFPEKVVLFPDVEGDLTPKQTIALGEAIRLQKNVSIVYVYQQPMIIADLVVMLTVAPQLVQQPYWAEGA